MGPRNSKRVAGLVAGATAAPLIALSGGQAGAVDGKPAATALDGRGPLVVGHRGASGYRPEHTLASYELAARMGADYLEPDLVATKDGVLVARHENEISGTTNVESVPAFANRRTTKTIDGVEVTGWFTEDFTLRELRRLRAKERLPAVRQESTMFDGQYGIPTLQEIIDLSARLTRDLGRPIGIFPETKHPTYFASIGLPLEEPLVAVLRRNGLDRTDAPVIVQSFETGSLRKLNGRLGARVPLVQLTGSGAPYDLASAGDGRTYADLLTAPGLRWIASYADGIGPAKDQVILRNADGTLGRPTSVISDAHRFNLKVIPYTFRAENMFLPTNYRRGTEADEFGRALDEMSVFFRHGVDGVFTDQPDVGVAARDRLSYELRAG